MQSHSPTTSSIKSKYPTMAVDIEIIADALEAINQEEGFLDTFSKENLESLYKTEMINPSYFPGLSNAAAKTIVSLHTANPELAVSVLLKTTHSLACRGRPWESLSAFSRIAISCPKQINEEMLSYLSNVNSDILEICSYEIEKKAKESKQASSGAIGIASPFLSRVLEVNITQLVEHKIAWARQQSGFRW